MCWLPVSSLSLGAPVLIRVHLLFIAKASEPRIGHFVADEYLLAGEKEADGRRDGLRSVFASPCPTPVKNNATWECWNRIRTFLSLYSVFLLNRTLPYLFSKVESVIDYLRWTVFLVCDGMERKHIHGSFFGSYGSWKDTMPGSSFSCYLPVQGMKLPNT